MKHWIAAAVCALAACAPAQQMPFSQSAERGAYGALTVQGAKDSLSGYSNLWNFSAGYDFGQRLSLEAGIPFYALASSSVEQATVSHTGVGTTTQQTSATNLLGDVYLRGIFACTACGRVGYTLTAKATAPTGDTSAGISTGRATWNLNNHVESALGRVTPYLEAGAGNTIADSSKYYRSYTTLGYIAPFAAGLSVNLARRVSFDASTYYDLPFGNQKLYSREVARGTSIPPGTFRNRPVLEQYMSQGSASLTEDHGYNGSLSIAPTPRVSLSASYNRSIPDALDSVTLALSFRVGHIPGGSAN